MGLFDRKYPKTEDGQSTKPDREPWMDHHGQHGTWCKYCNRFRFDAPETD